VPERALLAAISRSKVPSLLDALRELVEAHRSAFRQERTFRRMQALLFGQLFSFARRTVTQALVALGMSDRDWSAFYRLFNEPRIDYEELARCFFWETLPHVLQMEPYVAVVDGVQIPRHSHKMPGTSWLKSPRTPPFMPGPHRAQRFVHLAALLPRTEEGYSRALPLRWEPAFPEKAVLPEGMEPRKEWEVALDALRWLRKRLDEAGRASRRLLVLGDGGFWVAKFFRELPQGVDLMARCARNRTLYALPKQ
jgi:DDE superfamily endonuclease